MVAARRNGKDWYVGAMTDWNPRGINLPVNFLGASKFQAEIYADASDAGEKSLDVEIS